MNAIVRRIAPLSLALATILASNLFGQTTPQEPPTGHTPGGFVSKVYVYRAFGVGIASATRRPGESDESLRQRAAGMALSYCMGSLANSLENQVASVRSQPRVISAQSRSFEADPGNPAVSVSLDGDDCTAAVTINGTHTIDALLAPSPTE